MSQSGQAPQDRQGHVPATELREFVRESNRIEGITRDPLPIEIDAHEDLLAATELTVPQVERFVVAIANRPLRDTVGQNVRIGQHFPPPGGPAIRLALTDLCIDIDARVLSPYAAHLRYETLHPFLDGNGRSGRAIWAWQMRRDGEDPFALPFLHRFYYQTLDASAR